MHVTYCIIGAGPTGLAAGYGLSRLGEDDFLILERDSRIGGHAAGAKDTAGFVWDYSPLPLSGRYKTFTRILDDLLGHDAPQVFREAWIRAGGAWVPFPFQRNLRYLPSFQRLECVLGLLPGQSEEAPPQNLGQWFLQAFGPGISELFLAPHAQKQWGVPLNELAWEWARERIVPAELARVLETIFLEKDDTGHGPHAQFRTPAFGGTAELFRRMAKRLRERILIGQDVVRIDSVAKTVHVRGAEPMTYDHLLSTMPLTRLVGEVLDGPPEPVRRAASGLRHTSALAVGLGVRGGRRGTAHWMYFPQDNCPFHRVTHLHNFASTRTPGHEDRALLAEVAWCGAAPAAPEALISDVLAGLENVSLLPAGSRESVISQWHTLREYAAPLPDLGRDAALRTVQPYLETLGICSRGLFGGWRHETGDLEQCVMQGIEWARHMVHGEPETVYTSTESVHCQPEPPAL